MFQPDISFYGKIIQKFDFGWCSAPDSAEGAFCTPPNPLAELTGTISKRGEGNGGEGWGRG